MTVSKHASRRSLGSDLAKVAAHVIQTDEYDEELTDAMLHKRMLCSIADFNSNFNSTFRWASQ